MFCIILIYSLIQNFYQLNLLLVALVVVYTLKAAFTSSSETRRRECFSVSCTNSSNWISLSPLQNALVIFGKHFNCFKIKINNYLIVRITVQIDGRDEAVHFCLGRCDSQSWEAISQLRWSQFSVSVSVKQFECITRLSRARDSLKIIGNSDTTYELGFKLYAQDKFKNIIIGYRLIYHHIIIEIKIRRLYYDVRVYCSSVYDPILHQYNAIPLCILIFGENLKDIS